jgi:hypothetical protein
MSPSQKSKEEGWRFVLLAPGMYRIKLTSKGQVNWKTVDGHILAPSFVLKVPRGRPIVYAGSLQIPCEKENLGGSEWFCSSEMNVVDETDKARELVDKAFSGLGTVSTSLMTHYGASIRAADLKRLMPITLVTKSVDPSIPGPPLSKRAKGWEEPPDPPSSAGAWGAGILRGLYFGIWMIGSIFKGMGHQWQKAVDDNENKKLAQMAKGLNDEMLKAVKDKPIHERLRDRLLRRLSDHGIKESQNLPAASTSHFLQAIVTSLDLKPCEERLSYSLEVEINASLHKSESDEPLYLTSFRYADSIGLHKLGSDEALHLTYYQQADPISFATLAKPYAECHSLDDWVGEKGRKLFRKELNKGLDALVDQILPKVGAAGTVK